ncbi:hypothetical protein ACH5RR_027847 [Cinchona calisaya]|uniref:Uncharacterized protein n=1 Tax=Cinchona calisaya TaxID=153742 RepID=A0ABD2YM12_9GENT
MGFLTLTKILLHDPKTALKCLLAKVDEKIQQFVGFKVGKIFNFSLGGAFRSRVFVSPPSESSDHADFQQIVKYLTDAKVDEEEEEISYTQDTKIEEDQESHVMDYFVTFPDSDSDADKLSELPAEEEMFAHQDISDADLEEIMFVHRDYGLNFDYYDDHLAMHEEETTYNNYNHQNYYDSLGFRYVGYRDDFRYGRYFPAFEYSIFFHRAF